MSEWEECKLGGVIELLYGKGLKKANRKQGNIPVYGSNGIVGYHDEYLVKGPGIIVGRKGSVGEIKYSIHDFFPIDTTYYVNIKSGNDIKFLYYFLLTLQLNKMNSHSAVPGLNRNDVYLLDVSLPPLPEQRAIAGVLSSLDDKIDLLHRQNKTLEDMAESLFRQWFVEEADEGWEERCLGDIIELVYGKGLRQDVISGRGYPVIGSSGVVGYHSDFLVKGPGIVIGRKGTLGKVIYLWDNFFPIDMTYYIKSKVESAGLLYEYFLLKALNFEEINSDSAVPGLNRDIALSTEIKIAPLGELQKFNQFTSTFIDKLRENTKQIRTLEKLRDTLLPKLMSGKLRVET